MNLKSDNPRHLIHFPFSDVPENLKKVGCKGGAVPAGGKNHALIYEYFKDKYETVRIQGYKLPGKKMKINVGRFVLSNIFLPLFWFTSTLKVKLHEFNFTPDVIVSDFEPIGISLAGLLRKKCVIVFGYDPFLFEEYKKKNNRAL